MAQTRQWYGIGVPDATAMTTAIVGTGDNAFNTVGASYVTDNEVNWPAACFLTHPGNEQISWTGVGLSAYQISFWSKAPVLTERWVCHWQDSGGITFNGINASPTTCSITSSIGTNVGGLGSLAGITEYSWWCLNKYANPISPPLQLEVYNWTGTALSKIVNVTTTTLGGVAMDRVFLDSGNKAFIRVETSRNTTPSWTPLGPTKSMNVDDDYFHFYDPRRGE